MGKRKREDSQKRILKELEKLKKKIKRSRKERRRRHRSSTSLTSSSDSSHDSKRRKSTRCRSPTESRDSQERHSRGTSRKTSLSQEQSGRRHPRDAPSEDSPSGSTRSERNSQSVSRGHSVDSSKRGSSSESKLRGTSRRIGSPTKTSGRRHPPEDLDPSKKSERLGDDHSSIKKVPQTEHDNSTMGPNKEDADLGHLGGDPFAKNTVTDPINKTLASLWQKVIQLGLEKEMRKELADKYPPPENCSTMAAPALNAELKNIIGSTGVKKDHFQSASQNQLGAALSALGKSLTQMLDFQKSTKASDSTKKFVSEITATISDAGKILTDLHHAISLTRRSFVTSGRDPILKSIADVTTVDKFLFGEKFTEHLKAAKEVEKVAKDLTKTASKTDTKKSYSLPSGAGPSTSSRGGNLNWRAPPRKSYPSYRRGGQQSRPSSNRYQQKKN